MLECKQPYNESLYSDSFFQTIGKLRSQTSDYHKKETKARIGSNLNAAMERWMQDSVNAAAIIWKDQELTDWQLTNYFEDAHNKRDYFHEIENGQGIWGQGKWRQANSGSDVGVALMQPYPKKHILKEVLSDNPDRLYDKEYSKSYQWARDFIFDGTFYFCLNNAWDKLRVIQFQPVKRRIHEFFRVYLNEKFALDFDYSPNKGRSFKHPDFQGYDLRIKRDSGKSGWDSKAIKVICYVTEEAALEVAPYLEINMIDPPEYFGDLLK